MGGSGLGVGCSWALSLIRQALVKGRVAYDGCSRCIRRTVVACAGGWAARRITQDGSTGGEHTSKSRLFTKLCPLKPSPRTPHSAHHSPRVADSHHNVARSAKKKQLTKSANLRINRTNCTQIFDDRKGGTSTATIAREDGGSAWTRNACGCRCGSGSVVSVQRIKSGQMTPPSREQTCAQKGIWATPVKTTKRRFQFIYILLLG